MKLAIVLLACVGFVAAGSSPPKHKDVKIADKDFLQKQKFLFEIVYRIEDPLMFEEYIKLGKNLIFDKNQYTEFDHYMVKFYQAYKLGAILPQGEFFGALAKTHMQQALGLFNYLYYAKDWATFVQNACWARLNVNEGMFVYALTLAVIHRADCQGLILPSIYEILPQQFFNSKFIYQAEKFDYNVWSKYIMYEKEFKDIYYKDVKDIHGNYIYMKDWKMWQWWKMMGLEQKFYLEDLNQVYQNTEASAKNPKWMEAMKGLQAFWMPVDYTRDLEIFNDDSQLSYFTEDLGWNSYWYYLNMDYNGLLNGKAMGLDKDRYIEYWNYNVQQLLARYYMERLSNGFGEIETLSWHDTVSTGYDPQLISYNGIGYSYRKNYWEMYSYGNGQLLSKAIAFEKRVFEILDTGYYKTADGTTINFRKPESIQYIGQILTGPLDEYDHQFLSYYLMLASMYFGDVQCNDMEVYPNVMMNYETMMRDPLAYMFYKKAAEIFYRFQYHLGPYKNEELLFNGVAINDVHVGQLMTYYDLANYDVSNLLNDKMTFVEGQFVWDKTLLARQIRLNHQPINIDLTITSDKAQKVVIRSFLGPKYDEYGRVISLAQNRENFWELDQFVYQLTAGKNQIQRCSNDYMWTSNNRTSYTELYRYLMLAINGQYEFPLDISEPHCAFPNNLLLPQGWAKGMPMQMFFIVSPYTADQEQYSTFDYTYSCGIGSGTRYIDNMPFGYPFNRVIDEYEFNVPNMYFKDVKIYHQDKFEKYYENYEHFGTYDYTL